MTLEFIFIVWVTVNICIGYLVTMLLFICNLDFPLLPNEFHKLDANWFFSVLVSLIIFVIIPIAYLAKLGYCLYVYLDKKIK